MVYRRISLPRLISIILLLTFAFIFWKIFRNGSIARFQYTCNMTDEYQRNLEELFHRLVFWFTHLICFKFTILVRFSVASQLERHNFVVFLCYGTLWGEIRQSRLLPWSHKAELCILEEQLIEYGPKDFVKDFERNHLNVRYIATDGYYNIESDSIGWSTQTMSKPFVEIFIFAKDRQVKSSSHLSSLHFII